jgi:hypothetical protein
LPSPAFHLGGSSLMLDMGICRQTELTAHSQYLAEELCVANMRCVTPAQSVSKPTETPSVSTTSYNGDNGAK